MEAEGPGNGGTKLMDFPQDALRALRGDWLDVAEQDRDPGSLARLRWSRRG
jgi:hypothetical protein